MVRRVSELMTRTVTTVHADDTVERARREMELSNIRHLPVVDEGGLLVGIVSERDLHGAQGPRSAVAESMTEDVEAIAADTDLTEAAYLLLRDRIGSLPVCDAEGRVIGIVTETDLVRLAYQLLGGADLEARLQEDHESARLEP